MPQFKLTVKKGLEVLAEVEGRPVSWDMITVHDLQRTIEVEQWLEKMYGLRFHITEVL